MPIAAKIMNYKEESPYAHMLCQLKEVIRHSSHGHEQAAYALIVDLEELVSKGKISEGEFALVAGKAADVLAYFRYDFAALAREESWYRASVIHQMSCGMLQLLRFLRPDLNDHDMLSDTAYHLYRAPSSARHPHAAPITCKNW